MIRKINVMQSWFTLSILLVPTIAFALSWQLQMPSYLLRSESYEHLYARAAFFLLATFVWSVLLNTLELNQLPVAPNRFLRTIWATLLTSLLLAIPNIVRPSTSYSPLFLIFFSCFLVTGTLLLGQVFSSTAVWECVSRQTTHRIAIIGADEYAVNIAATLRQSSFCGVEVAGFVVLPNQTASIRAENAIPWAQLQDVIDRWHCQEILFAVPLVQFAEMKEARAGVRELCLPIRLILDLGDEILSSDRIYRFGDVQLLDVRTHPVESAHYAMTKRAFDILFAAITLLAISPLILLIVALIKLTSPGPVFFLQERVGWNGKPFKMLKFRSMVVQDHDTSNTQHTFSGDPRITPIGSVLRKTSFDELPQFINVIKGDMSVVGPRPELTHFVEKFRYEIPLYMARHNAKCGITGWAQINGLRGSHTSIPLRIQYDLDYLLNWSIFLDMKIIYKTVMSGFYGKNAF